MRLFFAHVTWKGRGGQRRPSPRESECSGKPTTRGANTSTARLGHRIIRLAVIFVHLFSHNMTTGNRTAGLGRGAKWWV
jgi:hypothetical protein